MITREVFTTLREIIQPMNIIKHVKFKIRNKYSTKQIYELVQILRKDTNILVTFFDPRIKECNMLFISNKDDYLLKKHIKDFLSLEVALND